MNPSHLWAMTEPKDNCVGIFQGVSPENRTGINVANKCFQSIFLANVLDRVAPGGEAVRIFDTVLLSSGIMILEKSGVPQRQPMLVIVAFGVVPQQRHRQT
jgi:hypothetical protein